MIKCPRCNREVSELDETCKYCGLKFSEYEERKSNRESNTDDKPSYVTGYNIFMWVVAIMIFIAGIVVGQEETTIMFTYWFSGIIFLVITNMLKNIVEELRILNSKIK